MPQDKVKILLIEHDPNFVRKLSHMLQQTRELAAELSPAPTLQAGLVALNHDRFDAIIFDVSVPDGAGLGNISLLRSKSPDLPILVAGSLDAEAMAVESVRAGAQDYLVKDQLAADWLERSIRYAIERQHVELALQTAEEKYHAIFDHLVEGIFQTSPDGTYLMANRALARIYGYDTPEELMLGMTDIGRTLYVREGRRAEFISVMQEHDTVTAFESQTYRKDGTVIWISENCRAVRDAQGRLLYYEGTVEDITQRKQTEENLHKSEALYHSLVETLPQNIFRKNPEGRFTFANQQFCKTLQKSLSEIVGKTDYDFFPAELAAKYQRDDQRVLETGRPYDTVEEHQPPGSDRKLYVQVVKTPIYGPQGEAIGLQGIFWDITHQRLAEERIRRANAQLAQSRKELREKNQEMEDDLKMAREIQLTMLPQQYPSFPLGTPAQESVFQFNHRYLPTGTVGGDFFTVSALSSTEVAVFVCDVAGHGIRSALVTAMIRALVEELKPVAREPGQFLTKLNSDLCAILKHSGSPLLTTAFYLVGDCSSGLMRYANAGHPKPVRVERAFGKVAFLANGLPKSQPALGLFDDALYRTSEIHLNSHDFVLLFTDGLVEVQNSNAELYTPAQLLQAISRHASRPGPALMDELLQEVKNFADGNRFSDDVCLVGFDFVRPVHGTLPLFPSTP